MRDLDVIESEMAAHEGHGRLERHCHIVHIVHAVVAESGAFQQIDGLPEGFTFHDLRHYLASLLIASGADIKTVQARMRHATARTTLDTYGHLWPDADESTRAAAGAVIAERLDSLESTAYPLRTEGPRSPHRRRSEG
jgi:hypothetical protein